MLRFFLSMALLWLLVISLWIHHFIWSQSTAGCAQLRELNASLRSNHKIRWSQWALDIARAVTIQGFLKLFHLIRATDSKLLGVSKTICKADDPSIHNQQRRIVCWAKHFQVQFDWPSAPAPPTSIPRSFKRPGTTNLSIKAETVKRIRALGYRKALGSDSFSSAPFKNGWMETIRELQVLFSKVWYSLGGIDYLARLVTVLTAGVLI